LQNIKEEDRRILEVRIVPDRRLVNCLDPGLWHSDMDEGACEGGGRPKPRLAALGYRVQHSTE
jgi:hypothetical protein